MISRYTKRTYDSADIDYNALASNLRLDVNTGFLLQKYGVNYQNAAEFFAYDAGGLRDPFLMHGMKQATEIVNNVIKNGETILIYGDYDADGISAAALLKLYFDSIKAKSSVYLPKRSDGYGLKIETLSKLAAQRNFDLLLTVDCGITAVNEVEFVKKILKRKVVVTDHHEASEKIPDCICVNPKLGYPFRDLSGSGVALKLVQALSDEKTATYFCDLASIGTIGDVMPMQDENRAIVKLAALNQNNIGLKALLESNKVEGFGCSDISLKICPKINAAGRVDDPEIALNLLLAENAAAAKTKAALLSEVNNKRQEITETSYAEALDFIRTHGLENKKAIFVYGEKWKHGILGLVANRLVEKYKVPVGAFMPDGDNIIGSMRTPDGLNLFETVTALKSYLLRFGGHKMSVGVTLRKETFKDFYAAFLEQCDKKDFCDEIFYDQEFDETFLTDDFFEKLKAFEPVLPSEKVVFYGRFSAKNFSLFGKSKKFLRVLTQNDFELKSFADFSPFFEAFKHNCNFECVFTLEYDDFAKRTVGNIIDLNILNSVNFDDIYLSNFIDGLDVNRTLEEEKETFTLADINAFLNEGNCCCVFGSMLEFEEIAEKINTENCFLNFFVPRQYTNTILISPSQNADLSKFKSVLYFNDYIPLFSEHQKSDNAFYFESYAKTPSFISGQKLNRDICVKVYKSVLPNLNRCLSFYELYLKSGVFEVSFASFCFVLKIFEELKIFTVNENPFMFTQNKGVKVDLNSSKLYNIAII